MERVPPLECPEGDAGEQAGPGPGKGFYLSPPHWGLPCLWTRHDCRGYLSDVCSPIDSISHECLLQSQGASGASVGPPNLSLDIQGLMVEGMDDHSYLSSPLEAWSPVRAWAGDDRGGSRG